MPIISDLVGGRLSTTVATGFMIVAGVSRKGASKSLEAQSALRVGLTIAIIRGTAPKLGTATPSATAGHFFLWRLFARTGKTLSKSQDDTARKYSPARKRATLTQLGS